MIMGCSTSKLDDEEVVQLCKDRKSFIKQAVEQRSRFASGHIAYIQSMKRVSDALRDYIEGDEPREFLLDSSFITPPLKKGSSRFISITPNSFSPGVIQSKPTFKVNYLRSGGNTAVSVEERPQSPETFRIQTYSPAHQYGVDGFFAMQSSPMNPSYFTYSPNDRPNLPPPSPQASQWDFFWNPFSSLDYYGYPTRDSFDEAVNDDDIRGLRQVREEEGIPDLEEDETEKEEYQSVENEVDERTKIDSNCCCSDEVLVEDVDEDEEEEMEDADSGTENEHDVRDLQPQERVSIEISRSQTARQVEGGSREMKVGNDEGKKETPGFTVYVNRRPTSMTEVINDLEAQFMRVFSAANEVSALLEASKAQYISSSNELSATKMLNPVALLRSASSRSTSSRFLISSNMKEDGYESGTDLPDDSRRFHGSHQSTLDRLYVWEKKLYEEVRAGEKVRIAYEKKYKQLRHQDVKGDDPLALDKTRMALRDLDTQIKVSLQSVETISRRIEVLRDEELQPQLLELLQGFVRMWKVMAECHKTQKRTLDEAKLLLAGTPSKLEARRRSSISITEPHRLARSAANLESELRNWRACFESWITSQRSYMRALTGWLLRCLRFEPDASKLPFSPRRSSGTLPIFSLCIQWSRFLDALHEVPVLDGIDFCAAGMGSLYAQQLKDDNHRIQIGSKRFSDVSPGKLDLVEVHQMDDVMTGEKLAEVAIKVLCAGMSVAMNALSEFSTGSAEGCAELANQWANKRQVAT